MKIFVKVWHPPSLKKRLISSEFILHNRKRFFCLDRLRWRFQIRHRQSQWRSRSGQCRGKFQRESNATPTHETELKWSSSSRLALSCWHKQPFVFVQLSSAAKQTAVGSYYTTRVRNRGLCVCACVCVCVRVAVQTLRKSWSACKVSILPVTCQTGSTNSGNGIIRNGCVNLRRNEIVAVSEHDNPMHWIVQNVTI